ncbi:hypothetical protein [Streptomyces chartreusis]|uniref:hypothetical protein n=1 Tax=Streptomyces chartreusis TaxID=1969 RepID=UPI0036C3F2DF
MRQNHRPLLHYPGGDPEVTGIAWTLVYGAALTVTRPEGHVALGDHYLERRTGLLTAAACLDVKQLAWPQEDERPYLAERTWIIAELVRDHDAAHGTALAYRGSLAPRFTDQVILGLPQSYDSSEAYPSPPYLRREWLAFCDLEDVSW